MPLRQLLLSGANLSVLIFVVSSTLGVGLRLTVQQILAPLRNGRLVALSLGVNFLLIPLTAVVLARLLGLDEPLGIGLLLCGVAAGAPFLLKLAEFARGDMPFAVGLMVLLMVVTVGYVPTVLPLVLEGVTVDPLKIARSLVLLMLIPLALGLLVRARFEALAARAAPAVGKVSSIAMLFVVGLTTAAHLRSVVGVLGSFAILAAVVFVLLCAGVGWVFGGPGVPTRGVLALGTAQRNTAAALVVAGQNFTDPGVVVMITVVMIVSFAILMPLAGAIARRAPAAAPDAHAAGSR
jgi:BASS family bile acid:Na+ symporter